MDSIKYKAMLYSLLLMILLIALFIYTIVQNKTEVLDQKTAVHRTILSSTFEKAYLSIQRDLNALACDIAKDEEIVNAFAAKDRDLLYKLSLPYFARAKASNEVSVSGFVDATGTHFLRIQDPTYYGDNITHKRPVLDYAIKNQTSVTSIDVTVYGSSIISIMPMYRGKEFIGIIQTVAKIDRLQEILDTQGGIKTALAFSVKRLEEVLEKRASKTISGYSIVSSNDSLFEFLPQDFDFTTSNRHHLNGNDYIVSTRALNNYNNETVAVMMCAFDIGEDVDRYHQEITKLIVISLMIFIIIGYILNYGFRLLLTKIAKDTATIKESNKKLSFQLYTEPLTQLPNRNALVGNIFNEQIYAIVLLNIQNFKEINDFYGHIIGDEVLKNFARITASMIDQEAMRLFKMPSDELAICVCRSVKDEELKELAIAIVNTLGDDGFVIEEINMHILINCGAYIGDEPTSDVLPFLQNADMALTFAKKDKISYKLYDDSMLSKQEYEQNIQMTKKIKDALASGGFLLYYQPIFSSDTLDVVKYEALLRLRDDDGSIISPFLFLSVAKKSYLYLELSRFVITEIFKQLESTPHHYSINLSIEDIQDDDIRELLYQELERCNCGDRITFEILESEGIKNYEVVSRFIADVKAFGSLIAIDDFGTGYSNFAHVLQLDVDYVKIDGSLIKRLDVDENSQNIIRAIVEFSKHLRLKTVAEFVHSKDVMQVCQKLGVGYLQGFYLGEPNEQISSKKQADLDT